MSKKTIFLAAGQDGLRTSSEDGLIWSKPQTGKEGEYYKAIAFVNGICLAAGSYGGDNILSVTRDGQSWKTILKKAEYVNYIRGLGVDDKRFIALGGDPGSVGNSRTFVMLSQDGLDWSESKLVGGKHLLRRLARGGGRFVAVGDRGRRATSADAVTWTDAPEVKALDTLVDVTFGNDVFVGVGLHGLRMCSRDGLKWTDRQAGEEGEHLNSVVWAKDRFVAVGPTATFTSLEGKRWEKTKNDNAPQTFCYGAGKFVGLSWKGKIHFSTDAVHWKLAAKFDQNLEAVAFGEVETSP
jgi:hypothetical protein